MSCWLLSRIALLVLLAMQSASVAAAPREMELHPTYGTANSFVTISGADMMTSTRMYCRCVSLIVNIPARFFCRKTDCLFQIPQNGHRIGRHLVTAECNASLVGIHSLVRCQVPQQASGFYSLEITHNGRDFTSSGLIFEQVDAVISKAFPRQLNPTGGTLVTLQGAGFRDGLWCRTGFQEDAVMAAVSSSALLVCETLAVHDKNSRDAIHLSIVASRQQSSLSEMHDLVADGAKVKGAISSFQTKNTRIEEIMVEGQGFDIHLRNAWCKVGTVIVRGTVLSSSRLNCQLPFISRQCPALFVSFNQVDFTAVENMDWASESCSSRKQFSRLPVAVEARSLNAAWQENIRITNSWLHARLESAHNAGFPLFHETEILGTSNSFVARFSIRNKPTVRFVNPQKNPALGGGVLWVTGVDLRVGNDGSDSQSDSTVVGCVVKNGELIVGHAVSSAVGACEIPPLQLLRRIFSNNLDLADLRVAYASDTSGKKRTPTSNALSRIKPSRGSVSGGTPVRITVGSSVGWGLGGSSSGNTNLDGDFTANAGCRFGTVAVSGRWSTINEVECITPSRGTLHGNVEVAPVMDHKTNSFPAFDLDAETTFKYALF